MKLVSIAIAAIALTFATAGVASAGQCQLRNLSFVTTYNDGRLIINAEVWNIDTGAMAQVNNTGYCNVNTTTNSISGAVCKNWVQLALAAMLSNKKVWFNTTSSGCPTAPSNMLSGISNFGLNH